jgi:hypothetical protein
MYREVDQLKLKKKETKQRNTIRIEKNEMSLKKDYKNILTGKQMIKLAGGRK